MNKEKKLPHNEWAPEEEEKKTGRKRIRNVQPQNTEGTISTVPCASGKHVLGTCDCSLSQKAIDIKNLRFYSAMAHDLKWQTDNIHWSVISKTLQEIADRLANDETNFYETDQKLEQILGPVKPAD